MGDGRFLPEHRRRDVSKCYRDYCSTPQLDDSTGDALHRLMNQVVSVATPEQAIRSLYRAIRMYTSTERVHLPITDRAKVGKEERNLLRIGRNSANSSIQTGSRSPLQVIKGFARKQDLAQ